MLERGASLLRAVGLGRVVDRIGRRIAPSVGTFDVEIDGLRLHGDHIGQLYYVRELLESDRETTFVGLLKSSISAEMTVVEGGAHMGYVTLQAARAVGPSGRVIAFEANPPPSHSLGGTSPTTGSTIVSRSCPWPLPT